jgi:hypothetical protein
MGYAPLLHAIKQLAQHSEQLARCCRGLFALLFVMSAGNEAF